MTDTPRSNAVSPVVFMGSGGPDQTLEAVERADRFLSGLTVTIEKGFYTTTKPCPEAQAALATLRALSAALAAEKAENATRKSAVYIDDLTVTGLASDKADLKARAEALDAKLNEAVDTAKQAIDVIASVQDYKQPDDPTEENALTMCEHEVFDFDVESARASLASLEGDKPDE